MKIRHIWAVTRKEFDHIVRDGSTLFLVLFTPTLVLLLMAYALTVDLKISRLQYWIWIAAKLHKRSSNRLLPDRTSMFTRMPPAWMKSMPC